MSSCPLCAQAFARIRAEVIRLVALIPEGKFATYGSIATHLSVVARHVAFVMSALKEEESAPCRACIHVALRADADFRNSSGH